MNIDRTTGVPVIFRTNLDPSTLHSWIDSRKKAFPGAKFTMHFAPANLGNVPIGEFIEAMRAQPAPCANCGKVGHEVKDCLLPSLRTGFIEGCPVHNKNHESTTCLSLAGPETLFKLLVAGRANKPPLASTINWVELVRNGQFPEQPGYPWTRLFSRHWINNPATLALAQNVDYARPPVLPADPATASRAIILSKPDMDERFLTLQRPRGRSNQRLTQQVPVPEDDEMEEDPIPME